MSDWRSSTFRGVWSNLCLIDAAAIRFNQRIRLTKIVLHFDTRKDNWKRVLPLMDNDQFSTVCLRIIERKTITVIHLADCPYDGLNAASKIVKRFLFFFLVYQSQLWIPFHSNLKNRFCFFLLNFSWYL